MMWVCVYVYVFGDWDEKKIDSVTLTAENSKVYLKQFRLYDRVNICHYTLFCKQFIIWLYPEYCLAKILENCL